MKEAAEVIRTAIGYPLDEVIKRYSEEQEISLESAVEHAVETKRYLALCAMNPNKPYAMRGPIDEFWHTFVTFTSLYMDFSEKVAGHYLHHRPNTAPRVRTSYRLNLDAESEERPASETEMRGAYAAMLSDYESTFGAAPPVHLWPRPGELSKGSAQPDTCGCACGVCGRECSCLA